VTAIMGQDLIILRVYYKNESQEKEREKSKFKKFIKKINI
jgi:hypothetical protein